MGIMRHDRHTIRLGPRNDILFQLPLHDLIQVYGEQFLGRDVVARCGTRFPLLIKFLDASHVLGEQIHQSDELAAKQGLDDPGKTEAWYMLKVRDGATIRCGNVDGVTRQQVRDALVAGTIRECMREYTIQPGDAFLLYAGTMHYSKGGVLFYEIMQNSDVIIGLRKPGDDLTEAEKQAKVQAVLEGIHVEDGFEPKTRPVTLQEGANRRTFAFACTHFALERLDIVEPYSLDCDTERFYVLSQIEGASAVRCNELEVKLRPGQTCLLPASLGPVTLTKDWQQYTINLEGKDLTYISGGFCWSTNLDVNPEGCTFYIDEIRYE